MFVLVVRVVDVEQQQLLLLIDDAWLEMMLLTSDNGCFGNCTHCFLCSTT
jgi:hypothetical protein